MVMCIQNPFLQLMPMDPNNLLGNIKQSDTTFSAAFKPVLGIKQLVAKYIFPLISPYVVMLSQRFVLPEFALFIV